MSVRLRHATHLAAGIALLGVLSLGAIWLRDRTRHWERPTWRTGDFVRLRGAAQPTLPAWIMPVNPDCSRCMATLATVHASWKHRAWSCPLSILIVDTARLPRGLLTRVPPIEVWWDRTGIWRRRWGHRLYGELIRFDARGAMVETVSARELLGRPRPSCDTPSNAPARPRLTDPEKGRT